MVRAAVREVAVTRKLESLEVDHHRHEHREHAAAVLRQLGHHLGRALGQRHQQLGARDADVGGERRRRERRHALEHLGEEHLEEARRRPGHVRDVLHHAEHAARLAGVDRALEHTQHLPEHVGHRRHHRLRLAHLVLPLVRLARLGGVAEQRRERRERRPLHRRLGEVVERRHQHAGERAAVLRPRVGLDERRRHVRDDRDRRLVRRGLARGARARDELRELGPVAVDVELGAEAADRVAQLAPLRRVGLGRERLEEARLDRLPHLARDLRAHRRQVPPEQHRAQLAHLRAVREPGDQLRAHERRLRLAERVERRLGRLAHLVRRVEERLEREGAGRHWGGVVGCVVV